MKISLEKILGVKLNNITITVFMMMTMMMVTPDLSPDTGGLDNTAFWHQNVILWVL